ncbi:mechanosensitive ion channel family protein [Candidatus Saccharibacteria bacterium]|nr:mechanosensitive ion channel family protein [Candidatus Saccharibacteria bacterium]
MIENFDVNKLISALIYIVIAFIFYFIASRVIDLFFKKPQEKFTEKLTARQKQRMDTLRTMLKSIVTYVIIIALVLALLANFGVDVTSLLAGLGIATAIIGLAFQDLGKDLIAGFGIIMERQYEVGDLIEVDGFRGRVTSLSLKSTKIKNYRGKELVVANRKMTSLVNYSTHNTLAQVDIPVPYNVKTENISAILEKVCNDLREANLEQIVGEVKFYGPVKFDDSAVVWRVTAECEPYRHFVPQRMIRQAVQEEFRKARIEIPFQQIDIHNK